MTNTIEQIIAESMRVKEGLIQKNGEAIERIAATCIAALKRGGKIIIFGNGGSAADSQHFAAELVGRFKKERRPFAAIALTTNSSILTALANDYSYEVTFSRQVEALGASGDIAFAISTSGKSPNVLKAALAARERGITTIALTGGSGGSLATACDEAIVVPSQDTPRIQEAHLLIIHILCELIENGLT